VFALSMPIGSPSYQNLFPPILVRTSLLVVRMPADVVPVTPVAVYCIVVLVMPGAVLACTPVINTFAELVVDRAVAVVVPTTPVIDTFLLGLLLGGSHLRRGRYLDPALKNVDTAAPC
jgi:hypothetical protein